MTTDFDAFIKKIVDNEKIIITPNISKAFKLAEFSNENIFITGAGGSGKSVFIKNFVKYSSKKIIVLAPTGVAAINIGGETIHSFFKFPIGILDNNVKPTNKLRDMWDSFNTILIDEISMVRADVFNAINLVMKRAGDKSKPFGGKQIILIGDPFQLAPIVQRTEQDVFDKMYKSKWWFSSIDASIFNIIEFNDVFRQSDKDFINALNGFRKGTFDSSDIYFLNTRVKSCSSKKAVTITTTNAKADMINKENLNKIKSKSVVFTGRVSGKFPENNMIAPMNLELKVGAKVMVLRNDPISKLVNGSVVEVVNTDKEHEVVFVKSYDNDTVFQIRPVTWEQHSYTYIEGVLSKSKSGSYSQIPLKLAYSITSHKIQGATVDEAIIDFDRGVFATGQAYVAVSRVRSISGLFLKHNIKGSDFMVDKEVTEFFKMISYES